MTVCPGIKGAGCINVRTIQIFLTINKSHKVERLAKFKKKETCKPTVQEQDIVMQLEISRAKWNGWETRKEKCGNRND